LDYLHEFVIHCKKITLDEAKSHYARPFIVQREKFQEHGTSSKSTLMFDVSRLSEILKATEPKDQKRRFFYLEKDASTIGRAEGADIHIQHISISKQHARLDLTGGNPVLTDLGSTNGTFVNDTKLDPNVPTPLNDGDLVSFGSLGFKFFHAPTFFNVVANMLKKIGA